MRDPRVLKLGFILNPIFAWGDWLHPNMPTDASTNFEYNLGLARTAETAGFDYLFVVDGVFADAKSLPRVLSRFEPLTLLSALAVHTRRIGLVGTISVSYSEPYNIARQLASLDILSGGRAG